jgi:hypothetical protein
MYIYIYTYIYIHIALSIKVIQSVLCMALHRHWNHRARWPLGSAYGLLHPLRKWCHRPPTNSPVPGNPTGGPKKGTPGTPESDSLLHKKGEANPGVTRISAWWDPHMPDIYIYVYGTGFKHERHGLTNEHREFVLLFWVTVKMGYTLVYLIYCHLERELCDLPNVYPSW